MGLTVYACVAAWKIVGGSDLADKVEELASRCRSICTVYYAEGGPVIYEFYAKKHVLLRELRAAGLDELAKIVAECGDGDVSLLVNVL